MRRSSSTPSTDHRQLLYFIAEVIEKKGATAPEFVLKLVDKTATMGEKVLFECRVTGDPDPTIQWLADGKVISGDQQGVHLDSAADGTQRLIIDSVVVSQTAKYVCVAENVAGKEETAAKLTVKGGFKWKFPFSIVTFHLTTNLVLCSGCYSLRCSNRL